MTVDEARQLCSAAGLHVLSATAVGAQVRVCVKSVPTSASGLAGLTARLGRGVTYSFGDGTVDPTLWFAAAHEDA